MCHLRGSQSPSTASCLRLTLPRQCQLSAVCTQKSVAKPVHPDSLMNFPLAAVRRGMNPRGAGYVFGADICAQYCHRNNVKMMARAHQLMMEGFKWMFDEKLVTVWSAPNYCYRSAPPRHIPPSCRRLGVFSARWVFPWRSLGTRWCCRWAGASNPLNTTRLLNTNVCQLSCPLRPTLPPAEPRALCPLQFSEPASALFLAPALRAPL